MKMDDMVIISVDDHITEPATVFDNQLSGEAYATAPKLKVKSTGSNYWEYQGRKIQSVALNAVTGRVREEYGMEPTNLDQLRKGCWDVDARVGDMDINGIAASLNFSSLCGMDGGLFLRSPDKKMGLTHLRAYNDWHIDEWCGAHPARFIPLGILPLWDMDETVKEVRRLADKGCFAVTMSENPTIGGMPGVHSGYYEPLFKALADNETALCLHIGTGNISPHCSPESPIEANIATMPMAVAFGAADWLNLEALHRYPTLKLCFSESGIGWIPYLMERADYTHEQHHVWTHSKQYYGDMKPSEVFRRNITSCFVDDAYGLRNLDLIGEDNVCYEVDYPHSDAPWPNAPEILWKSAQFLTDAQIDKITHLNAMRLYKFPMFDHMAKEELTVGALRAKAAAAGVDTTLISTGGSQPLAPGEKPRPVTSADVQAMYAKHAETV
ncbi:MAG: amidohydrolase [Sphingomonadales bacterium]|nr:amidohydrolase [Sphingomonadales bacterium]